MPAQSGEADLLRLETDDTETSLTDTTIDILFDKAESDYSGYSRDVIFQAVVTMRVRQLWLAASKQVTYQQNETREQLSDMGKSLKDIYAEAKKRLDEMIAAEKPVALRTAVMKKIPTRIKGYPNG